MAELEEEVCEFCGGEGWVEVCDEDDCDVWPCTYCNKDGHYD